MSGRQTRVARAERAVAALGMEAIERSMDAFRARSLGCDPADIRREREATRRECRAAGATTRAEVGRFLAGRMGISVDELDAEAARFVAEWEAWRAG